MTETVFAIPSLGRHETIGLQTLATLDRLGVSNDQVFVFVADEEERGRYAQHCDCELIVGEHGVGRQRTIINAYFPEGTRIVSLDDDVELIRKNDSKVCPLDQPLLGVATRAFDLCDEVGAKFWGVPDTTNGFFMRHSAVFGLRGVCGAMYGEYGSIPDTQSPLNHSEDMEKTFLHYQKFGGIVRLDDISCKQKRLAPGGVVQNMGGKEERLAHYVEVTEMLLKKYPNLVAAKEKNWDKPEKGLTRVKVKTTSRHPSVLGLS